MAFRRLVVPSLLAVALLSGCDILEKIPLTPQDALRAAGKFGQATREKVEETAEGTVYRLSVESKREASWLEADRAMWSDLKHRCPEGQLHEDVSTQPLDDRSELSRFMMHPAGTLFVRTIRCHPKLPFEYDVAPGVSADEVWTDLYHSLGTAASGETSQSMVTWLYSNDYTPRYLQLQQTLAYHLHARLAHCPQGVVVRNLTLGVMPPATVTTDEPQPEALLGFITECVVAPAAPPPAGG